MDAVLLEFLYPLALMSGGLAAAYIGGVESAKRGHFRDRIFFAVFILSGIPVLIVLLLLPKFLAVLVGFGLWGFVPRKWPEATKLESTVKTETPAEADFIQRRSNSK